MNILLKKSSIDQQWVHQNTCKVIQGFFFPKSKIFNKPKQGFKKLQKINWSHQQPFPQSTKWGIGTNHSPHIHALKPNFGCQHLSFRMLWMQHIQQTHNFLTHLQHLLVDRINHFPISWITPMFLWVPFQLQKKSKRDLKLLYSIKGLPLFNNKNMEVNCRRWLLFSDTKSNCN